MFLNNFKTKLNFISKFGFNKFLNKMNPIMTRNYSTCNYINASCQFEMLNANEISKQMSESISINSNEILENQITEEKIVSDIPTAEFLNKTSKLAIRKRKKRKYGKKISLRYR